MQTFCTCGLLLELLHVLRELLVLGTDFIDELRVGSELLPQCDSPRFRIGFRIIHSDFEFEMAEIGPSDPLTNFCGLGKDTAVPIDPEVVTKSDRFDDQCVPGPRGCRIPLP